MNKKLILPIIIMLALVVLLSGIMNFQAGQAQEDSDSGDVGPTIEEPETVTQKADPTPAKQTTTTVNSTPVAPAPAPTSFGGFGGPAAKPAKVEEPKAPVDDSKDQNVVSDFSYDTDCLTVNFTDLSQNATFVKWDLGDGNESFVQDLSYTYATSGNYTVELTVDGDDGESYSASKFVEVEECTEESETPEKNPDEGPEKVQEEIPEFPTVAIPMVAIIGMAFFFSRRQ